MSIFQYRQNIVVTLLMVMVIILSLKDSTGISGHPEIQRASRFPLKRRYASDRDPDIYEWEPLSVELKPVDRHDPSRLFDQLNKETILDNNIVPDLFAELDNNFDYIKSLSFKNRMKVNTADQLQATKEREKLCQWLNDTKDDTNTDDLEESFHEEDKQKERQRQLERFQSAAADREFERMLNLQREKAEGADAVFHPLGGSVVEPTEAKMNLLAKAMSCNRASKVPLQKTRPNLCTTKSLTTAGTCPVRTTATCSTTYRATTKPPMLPTQICLPPPTSCPEKLPEKPPKCKKKQPLIESSTTEQLLKIIKGMKQHALLILKTLNYLEMEILDKSAESCKRHEESRGSVSQKKPQEGPTSPQKARERLDQPRTKTLPRPQIQQNRHHHNHRHRSFYFGVRPLEYMEDVDAARNEELKLEKKVIEEHHLQRQQLKARENQWLQKKAKRARYEEAPSAAARLETIYPRGMQIEKGLEDDVGSNINNKANSTVNLKTMSVIVQPIVPPPVQIEEVDPLQNEEAIVTANRQPKTKSYAISDHQLVLNQIKQPKIRPEIRRRKKKKKNKQKVLATVILRPERLPLEKREKIRWQQQQSQRRRRNRDRRRQYIS